MASVTLTITGACGSGGHFDIRATGARNGMIRGIHKDDLALPITADDMMSFMRVVMQLALTDRSPAQLRADLESGLGITI